MPITTTTSAAALHLLLLLLLSFTIRPLSSTTATPQPRRILHQPLLPEDPSSPPPAPSPPKYPFTASAPDNSPFFQSYPSPPPPPPAPASFASFPANISSITVPGPTKPNSSSSKLIIAAVAAVVAAITVVSLAVFLHLRHRTASRRSSSFNQSKPPNSDTSSVVSFNQAPNTHHIPKLLRPSQSSSEFLYLGTLVNSHAPPAAAATASGGGTTRTNYSIAANSRKLDSPELRPLPPLNTRQQCSGNNAEVISSKDDESEEFYSPKGSINGRESSIGAGSASRRAFATVVAENFNGSTSNSSSTYSSSVPGSGSPARSASFSLSPANNQSSINSIPKSPDLIEIQTVAPLPPQTASPPEARISTPQVSASPSPSSSCSPERHSRRSDEISPRNASVLDQSLESPAEINSLVLHNTIANPTCQSPLSSQTSSSPESSPRYSSVSDRSVESPVRSYIAVEIELHNANDIPTSPELLEFATPLALSSSPKNSNVSDQNLESPVRDISHLQHTIPSPPEIRGLDVLESASPIPLSSLSPERCPTKSAESSPRNSNVSDQFAESPVRSHSPVHNNPAVTPLPEMQGFVLPDSSPAALPNSDVWNWNVESPVRSSSPPHQDAAEIATASEIRPLSPERCSMRSEESSPTNSDSGHTEAPVMISSSEQHNSTVIPTATETEALASPEFGSPLAMGSYSTRSYLSSEESSPRNSNISDQNQESPVEIISSTATAHNSDEMPASPELEALVLPESTSAFAFTSSSPARYLRSEDSSPRSSNVSDEHMESPSPPDSPAPDNHSGKNEDTSPRISNASDQDAESPVMQDLVLSPPLVCIPPPPPPPPPAPPQRLSPRTPTPPAKNRLEPPALINPLRPISVESSTLISPMQLPSEDPQNDEDALNPKPKLKPLHWDKVRASSDREMVWDQLKCSSFKLDEEMIESLFVVNTPKPNPNESTRWQVLPPPGFDNGDKVLDPKKSQNIAILLKALHVTVDEVCEGLLEGNAEILGTELLESLLKMAPSKEEERKLKEHDDDSAVKLGPAERFLKAVIDVPHAFRRVEALLYVSNFESEVEYLKTSFATLEAACEELRTSRMFLKLLEAVLKTGNRMNVGTNRGDAHAFKLDTLLKLVDVKGADGKTTLLHFVVQEIIRSEGARLSGEQHHTVEDTSNDARCRKLGLQVVSALTLDLSNVKKAAVMDAEVLSTYVSKLSKGITNVNEILKLNEAASMEESSKFAESMNSFINNAEEEIFKIQAQERLALSLVKEITEYFHGNSAMEEPHPFRIFMVVRDFLTVLDRVCKEVGMINERTIVSSAHRFPVPVNPMLQQATGPFHRRQQTSSDDESLLPFNV